MKKWETEMTMWSERCGNEVYVFHNGELVYKRWLDDNGQKRQPSLLANKGWPSIWITEPKHPLSKSNTGSRLE